MMKALKKTARRLLASRGYTVSWSLPWKLAGVHLEADLPRVITVDSPVIVDIGANTGQTIEMMLRVFTRPQVFAFEPSSRTFATLRRRYGNECRGMFQMAIGDSDTEQVLINYSSSLFTSLHKLHPEAALHHDVSELRVLDSETVPSRRMDSLLPELGINRIDLLKIDTQGHDLAVLRGAANTLQSGIVRAVLIEVNFLSMYEGEGSWLEIAGTLDAAGYKLVDFYEKHRSGNVLSWCNCLYQKTGASS
jgi:FkbM family methyltransferase